MQFMTQVNISKVSFLTHEKDKKKLQKASQFKFLIFTGLLVPDQVGF